MNLSQSQIKNIDEVKFTNLQCHSQKDKNENNCEIQSNDHSFDDEILACMDIEDNNDLIQDLEGEEEGLICKKENKFTDQSASRFENENKLREQLDRKGIFISECYFINKFDSEKLEEFESYFKEHFVQFKKEELHFICFNSSLLKNGKMRMHIHQFIEGKYPELTSFTRGEKNTVFVFKKNSDFLPFVFEYENQSLYIVLCEKFAYSNRQYYKLIPDLYNKQFSKENKIHPEETSNLNKNNQEDIKNSEDFQDDNSNHYIDEKIKLHKNNQDQISCKDSFHPYLPIITAIEIANSFNTSVEIKVPFINRNDLILKNQPYCNGFKVMFCDYHLSYKILILDTHSNKFSEKYELNVDTAIFDTLESDFKKFSILLVNLEPNKIYFIKILLKFGKFISSYSPIFTLRTSYLIDETSSKSLNASIKKELLKITSEESNFMGKFHNSILDTRTKNQNMIFKKSENENLSVTSNLKSAIISNYGNLQDYFINIDKIFILLNSSTILSNKKNNDIINESNFKENIIEDEIMDQDEVEVLESEEKQNYNISKENSDFQTCLNSSQLYLSDVFINNKFPFQKIPIIKIASNKHFILALDSAGNIYSQGYNKFFQLGINSPSSTFTRNLNKIHFSPNNRESDKNGGLIFQSANDIFIYDIAINKYSCFALGIINGKQKLYGWGLGFGNEKCIFNNDEIKEGILINEGDIDSADNIYLNYSNTPIEIHEATIVSGNIIKIISGISHSFLILRKFTDKNLPINICIKISIFNFEDFKENKEKETPLHFSQRMFNITYFERNKLSVLDISCNFENTIFLVENLQKNKKEVYGHGFNFFGQLGNIEKNIVKGDPVLIYFEELENPVKIHLSSTFSFIMSENFLLDNNKKELRLYKIGLGMPIFGENKLIFSDISKSQLITEIPLGVFIERNIHKFHFHKNSLYLLMDGENKP